MDSLIPRPVSGLIGAADILAICVNLATVIVAPELEGATAFATVIEQFVVGSALYQKVEIAKDIVQIVDGLLGIVEKYQHITGGSPGSDMTIPLKRISDALVAQVSQCEGKSVADILCGAFTGTDTLADGTTQTVMICDALLRHKDTQHYKLGDKFSTVSELIVDLIQNGYIRL